MPRVEEDLLQRRPFRSDKERLLVTIMRTSAWLCDEFNRELEPYGISQQQYNVRGFSVAVVSRFRPVTFAAV